MAENNAVVIEFPLYSLFPIVRMFVNMRFLASATQRSISTAILKFRVVPQKFNVPVINRQSNNTRKFCHFSMRLAKGKLTVPNCVLFSLGFCNAAKNTDRNYKKYKSIF